MSRKLVGTLASEWSLFVDLRRHWCRPLSLVSRYRPFVWSIGGHDCAGNGIYEINYYFNSRLCRTLVFLRWPLGVNIYYDLTGVLFSVTSYVFYNTFWRRKYTFCWNVIVLEQSPRLPKRKRGCVSRNGQ